LPAKKEHTVVTLSKSKLLAFRQCPKKLWLELHGPKPQFSAATRASFEVGNQVGKIARQLYDPKGVGQLLIPKEEGYPAALARTTQLLTAAQPIFEATLSAGGALALADVMLASRKGGKRVWRMIEVKSSTEVKDCYRDDVAIQAFVARKAGVSLTSVSLAHIDSQWVYPGGNDYQGLLVENDLTAEAFGREAEVKDWIAEAQVISRKRVAPVMSTGRHCNDPNECGFLEYCQSKEPQFQYPVKWLPRVQTKALKALIEGDGVADMRDVPDTLLNERQLRVKSHTLSGSIYFDAPNATADLASHKLPIYFLDFETIMFPVPIWKGTRPYQAIPFQFSSHRLSRTGKLEHQSFIDLSGDDPSKAFAVALIAACGESGSIFAYSASFEKTRIKELADRFPRLKRSLLAINERVVDLRRIAEQRYYHPDQKGRWGIKKVLPTVFPDLRYDALNGVQDGGMAMEAYSEAVSFNTNKPRKAEIEEQLLKYCGLDTYAMVKLWQFFSGRTDLKL
jgi:hypothetical protein